MSSHYTGPPHPGHPDSHGGTVPLWAPYYRASLPTAFKRFWQKYATFSGRASRSEYWWWTLVSSVVGLILEAIGLSSGAMRGANMNGMFVPGPGLAIFGGLGGLWFLATIVPSLALVWRRLHDTNLAGGFFFLVFIPFAGSIILLVLTLLPPSPGGVRFDRPEYPTPYPPNMPPPPPTQD